MLSNDPVIKNRLRIIKRNEYIKEEYKEMKRKGLKVSDIWQKLADKYFMSIENIKKILYKLNGSQ